MDLICAHAILTGSDLFFLRNNDPNRPYIAAPSRIHLRERENAAGISQGGVRTFDSSNSSPTPPPIFFFLLAEKSIYTYIYIEFEE
jgi:hypothetical protein